MFTKDSCFIFIEALFVAKKKSELLNEIFSFFNSDNCRVLAFPSYFLIADKCLEGHTILIVQHVPDMGLCELLCYNQPNCVSVNYEIQRERRCELNNSTHRAHDADFKEREGYLYHGATVSLFVFSFLVFFSFMICFHHLQGHGSLSHHSHHHHKRWHLRH